MPVTSSNSPTRTFTVRRPFSDQPTIQAFADSARRLLPRLEPHRAAGKSGQAAEPLKGWSRVAEAGWLSVLVPEELGGLGLDERHLSAILYEEGRQPTDLPILACAVQAVSVLRACPPSTLRDDLLKRIAAGESIAGLAWQEQAGQLDLDLPSTVAVPCTTGYRLQGTKRWVAPCTLANGWIAYVAIANEPALVWVSADAVGVDTLGGLRVDGSDVGEICFTQAPMEHWQVLAIGVVARDAVNVANDWTRLAGACNLLGTCSEMLDRTVEYLKTRVQFGRPLGTNQALQHRIVDQYMQVELTLACIEQSFEAVLGGLDLLASMASRAKARAAQTAVALGIEAIQMHGAIGYTQELPIGRLWKRSLHMQEWLGSIRAHRRRHLTCARLSEQAMSEKYPNAVVSMDIPSAEVPQLPESEFRNWLRGFLRKHCPAELRHAGKRFRWGQLRAWYETLGAARLLAPSWPCEFGGMGLTADKVIAFHDEFETFGCPRLHDQGVTLVGPILIRYGTQLQKERYLPLILSGGHVWCQGYSEPNAGSDLASLQTRGVIDGDVMAITGQKTWTTLAQDATHMFALVRTAERDKKQDGISFVLIDLSLPGVTIRPIVNLAGDDEFCEVFFDDARVPLTEVVGELHAGWTIAKSLLGFERLFNGSPRTSVRTLHQLQALAKQQGHFDNACFFDSFAELNLEAIDLKALYMHYENIVRSGHPLPQSVSILKVLSTETYTRIARALAESAMEHAADTQPLLVSGLPTLPHAPLLHAVATRIYGGTNEIQKNIIARHVLGLHA